MSRASLIGMVAAAVIVAALVAGLRAQCPPDRPAILVAHWSVSGGRVPSGVATDELREPVLDLHDLAAMGWDAVVLGHIHVPDVLHEQPPIFYCGSPAVVDFGEADVPHGVWILDVDGPRVERRYVELGDRPFVTLDADLESDPAIYQEMLAGDWSHADRMPGAVVRFRYRATAEQRVDHERIRRALLDAGAHRVYAIQPEIIRTDRARVDGLTEDVSPIEALEMWLETQDGIPDGIRGGTRDRTARYLEEVGP